MNGKEQKKETYFYDIEIFPNFLSLTFLSKDTDTKRVFVFRNNVTIEESKRLLFFVSKEVLYLIGYNNSKFDDFLLDDLINSRQDKGVSHFYNIAQKLINNQKEDEKTTYFKIKMLHKLVKSVDIMKVFAHDKLLISLKQCAVNIGWHLIQNLPVHYTQEHISKEEEELILSYNLNDVLITKKLMMDHLDKFNLRLEISKLYNIDVLNASDSKISCEILDSYYTTEANITVKELSALTKSKERKNIRIYDCVNQSIITQIEKENNVILKKTLNELLNEKNTFSKEVIMKQYDNSLVKFKLGIGGIHSVDKKLIIHETDAYAIIDIDVASFYPSIMLNDKVSPCHLESEVFLRILRRITEERLEAKKAKNTIKADSLKIVINSIYGKLGFEHYWLFDQEALIKVTINGQLYLLLLINLLINEKVVILSANTDGVTVYIKKNRIEEVKKVVKRKWEEAFNFNLEWVNYRSIFRRDVNNYIVVKDDGKLKCKGLFDLTSNISKGSKFSIVPEAVIKYFTEGIDPLLTITNSSNIFSFCESQKSNAKFTTYLVRVNEEDKEERIKLQKTNRYFVSYYDKTDKNCGCLVKEGGISPICILKGEYIIITNEANESDKALLSKVNKEFYLREIWDTIYTIKERQFSLF